MEGWDFPFYAFALCQNSFSWPAVRVEATYCAEFHRVPALAFPYNSFPRRRKMLDLMAFMVYTTWTASATGRRFWVWPLKALPFQRRSRYLRDKAAGSSTKRDRTLKAQRIPKLSRLSHLEALRQVASSAGHWWAHNTFPADKVNSDIQWHLETDKALSWPEGLASAELFATEVEPHHAVLSCLAYWCLLQHWLI